MAKIFLVEDDDYLSRVYERAFRFAGFEVELVKDGEEALKSFSTVSVPPAAVILDIYLPKVNGYDILVALRKDPRYAAVPIIMLTNSIGVDSAGRFLAAGADAYLVKIEHQTKDIVEQVQQIIQRGRGVPAKA